MVLLKFLNKFFSVMIAVLAIAVVFMLFAPTDGGFAQDASLKQNTTAEAVPEMTDAPNKPKEITHLPAFQLNGIGSADFSDDVMIVSFFSVWCDKCARENALFNKFKEKYNVPIYGINIFIKDTDDAEGFLKTLGNPFKKWGKDDFGLIAQALEHRSIPISMVITPDLKIHWRHNGELTEEIIENEMVPHLKELAAPRSILSLTHLPTSEAEEGLPHSEGRAE